jgi:hypothetical protein
VYFYPIYEDPNLLLVLVLPFKDGCMDEGNSRETCDSMNYL